MKNINYYMKKELIKIAVNKTYSSFDTNISNSDEIAFFLLLLVVKWEALPLK